MTLLLNKDPSNRFRIGCIVCIIIIIEKSGDCPLATDIQISALIIAQK